MPYYASLASLKQSAAHGCYICNRVWASLAVLVQNQERSTSVNGSVSSESSEIDGKDFYTLALLNGEHMWIIFRNEIKVVHSPDNSHVCSLLMCRDEGAVANTSTNANRQRFREIGYTKRVEPKMIAATTRSAESLN